MQSNSKSGSKQIVGLYIFDISNIINISKELADKYLIKDKDSNLERLCEQNKSTAIKCKRFDLVKVSIIFSVQHSISTNNWNWSFITLIYTNRFGTWWNSLLSMANRAFLYIRIRASRGRVRCLEGLSSTVCNDLI